MAAGFRCVTFAVKRHCGVMFRRTSTVGIIGILFLQETLSDPTWHKVVAYLGLGVALVGAVLITQATEGPKEQELESIESRVPAPAPTS